MTVRTAIVANYPGFGSGAPTFAAGKIPVAIPGNTIVTPGTITVIYRAG